MVVRCKECEGEMFCEPLRVYSKDLLVWHCTRCKRTADEFVPQDKTAVYK